MMLHYYHLSPEVLTILPMRRVWTLWDEIPAIQEVFWGKGEDKSSSEVDIKELARKFKIKLPRGF